jgi:hypothetical protein
MIAERNRSRMPLTQFGTACQLQRRRMNAVMAGQSVATGFSSSLISGIERGTINMPADYLKKVIEWMELDSNEATEFALLARLGPILKRTRAGKTQTQFEESLASILDRFEVKQPNPETVDEER